MFGVCYYPEHWPREQWETDARRMAGLGLSVVRIAEFAWSRIEPAPGEFELEWLDEAITTLESHGLQVVMCTPTATPPKWLIDKYPGVLPADPLSGTTRGFGSRRHYDFSSPDYRRESQRITELLTTRYGEHPAVIGWQTDNELCCHDTCQSGSEAAVVAFREWCSENYSSIGELNQRWGTVFWSMEYRSFEEIELPLYAVTECSPAHRLAYRRFSLDQVVAFQKEQIDIIRRNAPGRFVTHNFIPMKDTDTDFYAMAADLDFASYDNYPLGRSDLQFANWDSDKFKNIMRTGHPDFSAYAFDQVRALAGNRFWIMEQQPGPVNWANSNPRPAPGMVRLWTYEAFAHGADKVCYFRWRQAPYAQEQQHAGLRRPDDQPAEFWDEIAATISEITELGLTDASQTHADVAIVSDFHAYVLSDVERQSNHYEYPDEEFTIYHSLRSIGVDVDFVRSDSDLSNYKLVVVPCLPIISESFVSQLKTIDAQIVVFPRSGSKDDQFNIPAELAPGPLQSLMPFKISSVETLRPDCTESLNWNNDTYQSRIWREKLESSGCEVLASYDNGEAAILQKDNCIYVGTLTNQDFLSEFFKHLCTQRSIPCLELPATLRIRARGSLTFAMNYADTDAELPVPASAKFLIGSNPLGPHDVAVWQIA